MEKRYWAGADRPGAICIILAAFAFGAYPQEPAAADEPRPPAETRASPSAPDPAPADALEIWLNTLAFAESGNRQHLVHRDRDGQLYYGCLQFKETTFRAYAKKFHLLAKGTRAEMMRRIYDCSFQKRLASLMIRDDPENWKHWRGTIEKRVGPPPVEPGP
jgi:hypothetical protein